ncbi:hypothetical protein [Petrotoga sp. 9PW.55.5.1]|jgi:hypothetical protein|uniref:hypothetical protein n=1 Tax=Petrotoga sp. 9PW.55.5.1 TaxID=1308979 RepID=UPI001313E7F9|nr:hypothetical protein [Petrotoga sp. 9PW.55.5.1]
MNEKEEELLNDFFDGKINEEELNEECRKMAKLYKKIINKYFSCEENILNKVKNKLNLG